MDRPDGMDVECTREEPEPEPETDADSEEPAIPLPEWRRSEDERAPDSERRAR